MMMTMMTKMMIKLFVNSCKRPQRHPQTQTIRFLHERQHFPINTTFFLTLHFSHYNSFSHATFLFLILHFFFSHNISFLTKHFSHYISFFSQHYISLSSQHYAFLSLNTSFLFPTLNFFFSHNFYFLAQFVSQTFSFFS